MVDPDVCAVGRLVGVVVGCLVGALVGAVVAATLIRYTCQPVAYASSVKDWLQKHLAGDPADAARKHI